MAANYEVCGNEVRRDGIKIAEFGPEKGVVMESGYENYRIQAAQAVQRWNDSGDPGRPEKDDEWEDGKEIRSVGELVSAMQEFIPERCPPMTNLEGDYTPGVVDWIRRHDDVRKQVLKKYNRKGGETC